MSSFVEILVPAISALVGGGGVATFFSISHEKKLKADEAKSSLHKDVYLEAAEVLAEMFTELIRISQDQGSNDAEKANRIAGTINKIKLVGSLSTIQAISDFLIEYNKTSIEFYRYADLQHFRDKAWCESLITMLEENQLEMASLKKRMGIAQIQNDTGEVSFLSNQISRVSSQIDQIKAERGSVEFRVSNRKIEKVKIMIQRLVVLTEKLTEANIAIRKELKFDFDENLFREIEVKNTKAQEKMLVEYLQSFDSGAINA